MMKAYVVLLRGINVGGKNKVPMKDLKRVLEELGFRDVTTYIQSGNVVLRSDLKASVIAEKIEESLPKVFKLNSLVIRVLVLSVDQLKSVVENKPEGFGEHPETYHSDVIFLIEVETAEVLPVFKSREGVDMIWPGDGVVYSQRLSAERTKSRLNKIMESPLYQSMTIRNWNTTTKLLELVESI